MTSCRCVAFACAAVLLLACAAAAAPEAPAPAPAAYPRRLVAVGDIHGDYEQLRAVLVMSNLIDNATSQWSGGDATLVQMGDLVDRGPQDKKVIEFMMHLTKTAPLSGGSVVTLLGNHEVLTLAGKNHYVHKDALEDFGGRHGRKRAFSEATEFGAFFRTLPMVHSELGTVFVHAGLLPAFARLGLDAINAKAAKALEASNGAARTLDPTRASPLFGMKGPVWTRLLINRAMNGDCADVTESLEILGLDRMVVGHTPQRNGEIGSYCDGALLAIDVGMSKWMYGHLAALELTQESAAAEVVVMEIVAEGGAQQAAEAAAAKAKAADAADDTFDAALGKADSMVLQEMMDTLREHGSGATVGQPAFGDDDEL
jgi:hypothetical protein